MTNIRTSEGVPSPIRFTDANGTPLIIDKPAQTGMDFPRDLLPLNGKSTVEK